MRLRSRHGPRSLGMFQGDMPSAPLPYCSLPALLSLASFLRQMT